MKAIVVYYSLEGNTKLVAEEVAKNLGADVCRIEPKKEYPTGKVSKYLWGGKSVTFGEKPKLIPYQFSAKKYDLIIIGTPIWAGTYTPPIKTFLSENDLSRKAIAIYACNSGGEAEKCFQKIAKDLPDSRLVATMSLTDPLHKENSINLEKIKVFCENASRV